MKLILRYHDSGFECSFEVIIPIYYSSKEDLYVDFISRLEDAHKNNEWDFKFCNEEFDVYPFCDKSTGILYTDQIEILTVDEYYEQYALGEEK